MKTGNIFVFVMISMLTLTLGASSFGEKKFGAGIGAGIFASSDSQFREIYSETLFMPQLWAEFNVAEKIALWADLAYLAKNGFVADVSEDVNVKRWQFGLGAVYRAVATEKLRLSLGAGLAWFSYKEAGLGIESSGSAAGLKLRGTLDHKILEKLFLRLGAGYSLVKKTVEELELKLGGMELIIGLGLGL